jgi:hypothetical protein
MTTLDKILIFNSLISLIAHVYVAAKWVRKRTDKEVRLIRNHIIRNHVKADHGGRLKHCLDEACASLRTQASHLAQERQPVQAEQARTES